MATFRNISIASVSVSLSCAATAYGYRQSLISQRRQQLAVEYQELLAEHRKLDTEYGEIRKSVSADLVKIEKRGTIVDKLWADRFQRYSTEMLNLHGFAFALGEGLGMQRAVMNHYAHMVKTMPAFPRFDFGVSHTLNYVMMIHVARERGLGAVAADMTSLLHSEPLIKSVASSAILQKESLERAGGVDLHTPRNMHEVSSTFTQSLEELQSAVEAASAERERVAYQVPDEALSANKNGHSLSLFAQLAHDGLNGLIVNPDRETPLTSKFKERAGVGKPKKEEIEDASGSATVTGPMGVGSSLRIHTQSRVDELQKNGSGITLLDGASATEEGDSVTLSSNDDLMSAMSFVDQLDKSLQAPENAWLSDMPKRSAQPKLADTLDRFKVAVSALQTWRNAAELYLIDQQSIEALEAYERCLGKTLSYVDESINMNED